MTVPSSNRNSSDPPTGRPDPSPDTSTPQVNTIPIRLQPGTTRNIVINRSASNGNNTQRIHIQLRPSNSSSSNNAADSAQPGGTNNNIHVSVEGTNDGTGTTANSSSSSGTNSGGPQQQRRTPSANIQRIPLPSNHGQPRQVRIGVRGGSNGRGGGIHIQSSPAGVGTVRLAPLTPQPLPDPLQPTSNDPPTEAESNTAAANEKAEKVKEDHHRFKCPICFEFLQSPTSCGSCDTNYCHKCITRVAAASNNRPAKCPTCRSALNDLQKNHALEREIQAAHTIACRYQGCEEHLELRQVAQHEATCPYVVMKCRYSTFGCEWKGLRKNLQHHENHHCPLNKVGTLVEFCRHSRAQNDHNMALLNQRFVAIQGMMEMNAGMARRLARRPYHVGDLCDLVYTSVCLPSQFLFTKDLYRAFLTTPNARGHVYNTLCLFPTGLLLLKETILAYRSFLDLDFSQPDVQVLEASLMTFLVAVLGLLVLGCFWIDIKSTTHWTDYPMSDGMTRPLVRDMAAVSLLVVTATTFDPILCDKPWKHYIFVFPGYAIASVLFPAMVATILEAATGVAPSLDPKSAGRASDVISFGLRYGMLTAMFGFYACCDAFVLLQLARVNYSKIVEWGLVLERDVIFPDIFYENQSLLCMFTANLGGKVLEYKLEGRVSPAFAEALLCLAILNVGMDLMDKKGYQIGVLVAAMGRADLQPHQNGTHHGYSILGIAIFGLWTLALATIVLTY